MFQTRVRTDGPTSLRPSVSEILYIDRFVNNNWINYKKLYPLNQSGMTSWTKTTIDEVHYPGPPYLCGGLFHSIKRKGFHTNPVLNHISSYATDANGIRWRAQGIVSLNATVPNGTPQAVFSSTDLDQYESMVRSTHGASAWNKFRPAKPESGVSTFLAELRETPRMLMTSASLFYKKWRAVGGKMTMSSTPKAVSDHWLNTQFGWLPFVNDVRSFIKTTRNLDKHMNKLKRENGQWVHRRGSVENVTDTVDGPSSNTVSMHYPQNFLTSVFSKSPYGSYRFMRVDSIKTWFSAKFRYYIPELNQPNWENYAIKRIYGLEVTPTVIWNLVPWSWLVDWCSNAGDVISNIEASVNDDLCAKYAYLMSTRKRTLYCYSTLNVASNVYTAQAESSHEQKIRTSADPFGFDTAFSDFSNRQLSILSALGISRLR